MKKLLSIFLCLGIIASCTKEALISPEGDGDNSTVGQLSVYLQSPDVSTRSAWVYDEYFPDGDIFSSDSNQERWLHNISLVYFDSDMKLEHFSVLKNYVKEDNKAIDNYANPNWNNGYPEYTGSPLGIGSYPPVTTGYHYFYVFSNLPDDFLVTVKEIYEEKKNNLTKDEFEKIVMNFPIEQISAPYISKDGNSQPRCLNTNITSPEAHYMGDRSLVVNGGNSPYPEMNNVLMTIGKGFAKVSLAYVPENTTGTLDNVSYRMVNDPVKMYLMPNIFNGQVHPPHYDKYETNKADIEGYFETYYTNYFNPATRIEGPIGDYHDWRPASVASAKSYAYCLENGNEIPLQGNSTMVLVRAKYTPTKWLGIDNKPGNASSDGTFWRIRNSQGYSSDYYNQEPKVVGTYEAVKYTGGITYYPIWIETDGKYQVKRNHYYKIAVTGVLSAGAATPQEVLIPTAGFDSNSTGTRSAVSGNIVSEAATAIIWEQKN